MYSSHLYNIVVSTCMIDGNDGDSRYDVGATPTRVFESGSP